MSCIGRRRRQPASRSAALGDGVVLRVYPSHHTCALVTCGVLYQERKRNFEDHMGLAFPPGSELSRHLEASLGSLGIEDDGCLPYLLETPCWNALLEGFSWSLERDLAKPPG